MTLNSAAKENPQDFPAHVGIIMDGNGRWAKKRGLLRTQGHLEGLKAAKRVVKAAADLNLSYLTLYTFSTENWKRSSEEVGFIFGLLKQYLRSEMEFSTDNKIRVRHAGNREGLPKDVLKEIDDTCRDTESHEGMQVILALNYGGRDEIVRAVKKLTSQSEAITEENLSRYMDNPDIPNPDLVIRTAGEFRISNFLLWESAYTEYYISEKFWPDWDKEDLLDALNHYKKRERRFGAAQGTKK